MKAQDRPPEFPARTRVTELVCTMFCKKKKEKKRKKKEKRATAMQIAELSVRAAFTYFLAGGKKKGGGVGKGRREHAPTIVVAHWTRCSWFSRRKKKGKKKRGKGGRSRRQ